MRSISEGLSGARSSFLSYCDDNSEQVLSGYGGRVLTSSGKEEGAPPPVVFSHGARNGNMNLDDSNFGLKYSNGESSSLLLDSVRLPNNHTWYNNSNREYNNSIISNRSNNVMISDPSHDNQYTEQSTTKLRFGNLFPYDDPLYQSSSIPLTMSTTVNRGMLLPTSNSNSERSNHNGITHNMVHCDNQSKSSSMSSLIKLLQQLIDEKQCFYSDPRKSILSKEQLEFLTHVNKALQEAQNEESVSVRKFRDVSDQLTQSRSQIYQLQNEVSRLTLELKGKGQEVEEVSETWRIEQERSRELRLDYKQLEHALKDSEAIQNQKEETVTLLKSQLSQCEQESNDLSRELVILNQQKISQVDRITELQSLYSSSEAQWKKANEDLRTRYEDTIMKTASQHQIEIETFKDEVERLNSLLKSNLDGFESERRQKNSEYEAAYEQLRNVLAEEKDQCLSCYKNEIENLTDEKNQIQHSFLDFKNNVHAQMLDNNEVQRKLEIEIKNLNHRNQILTESGEESRALLEAETEVRKTAEEENLQKDEKLKTFMEEYKLLRDKVNRFEDLERSLMDHQAENHNLVEENESLNVELNNYINEVETLKQEKQTSAKKYENLYDEFLNIQREYDELENMKSEMDTLTNEQQATALNKIRSLQKDNYQLRQDLEHAKAEVQNQKQLYSKKMDLLTTETDEAKIFFQKKHANELSKLRADFSESNLRIEQLMKQCRAFQKMIQSRDEKIKNMREARQIETPQIESDRGSLRSSGECEGASHRNMSAEERCNQEISRLIQSEIALLSGEEADSVNTKLVRKILAENLKRIYQRFERRLEKKASS